MELILLIIGVCLLGVGGIVGYGIGYSAGYDEAAWDEDDEDDDDY